MEFEEIPFSEYGKVLTFSQVFQLPWGIDNLYLTIGIVKFDNGIKAMGQISTPDISIGDKVKCLWEKIRVIDGENVYGWRFHVDIPNHNVRKSISR